MSWGKLGWKRKCIPISLAPLSMESNYIWVKLISFGMISPLNHHHPPAGSEGNQSCDISILRILYVIHTNNKNTALPHFFGLCECFTSTLLSLLRHAFWLWRSMKKGTPLPSRPVLCSMGLWNISCKCLQNCKFQFNCIMILDSVNPSHQSSKKHSFFFGGWTWRVTSTTWNPKRWLQGRPSFGWWNSEASPKTKDERIQKGSPQKN